MKKLLFVLSCLLTIAVSTTVRSAASPQQESVVDPDSTLCVIGWFNKCDTLTYWINESGWKIGGVDTVRTSSATVKVRVNVVDSTANGYKMEYTFLEFPTDTLPESAPFMQKFQNDLIAKVSKKIIGTTVQFETDELGSITKFNNLGKIKKQADYILKETLNELSQVPEIKAAKNMGLDMNALVQKFGDNDIIIENYLKELKILFANHGYTFNKGISTEHLVATDSTYECDSYCSVLEDPENGSYQILRTVNNIIPESKLKEVFGDILSTISKQDITDGAKKIADKQINNAGSFEQYLKIDYIPNGWPYSVINQKTTIIGEYVEINQTTIALDSYHFAE